MVNFLFLVNRLLSCSLIIWRFGSFLSSLLRGISTSESLLLFSLDIFATEENLHRSLLFLIIYSLSGSTHHTKVSTAILIVIPDLWYHSNHPESITSLIALQGGPVSRYTHRFDTFTSSVSDPIFLDLIVFSYPFSGTLPGKVAFFLGAPYHCNHIVVIMI